MVIDTSALIAILLNESERDVFVDAISADPVKLISAVNALETAMVIEARKREAGGREFDLLLHRAGIDIVPFTQEQFEEARRVWRKYGKGNHPAGLNLCDCCAYALSATSGEPLLFKGNDFPRTDALPALFLPGKPAVASFHLVIQKTHYRRGSFNVPATFDACLGVHNAAIEIYIEGVETPIRGVVNRTATRNGTPRILGNAALRRQLQARFSVGTTVIVEIESPQRIRIRPR